MNCLDEVAERVDEFRKYCQYCGLSLVLTVTDGERVALVMTGPSNVLSQLLLNSTLGLIEANKENGYCNGDCSKCDGVLGGDDGKGCPVVH
jgi:hypothetical protein